MRRSWLLAIPVILLAGTNESRAIEPPYGFTPAWNTISGEFRNSLKEMNIAGGTLAFALKGEILAQVHYGLADRETGRSADVNTIYHWGSITKTLTGIAIMQLRDQGRLSLDDRIVDHLPELRPVHNPFGDIGDITIRHVMSHSAGFRGSSWPWGGGKNWHPHEPKEWDQLVAMMPYTEILFPPGSQYSYSNPAVIFLGRIIENISGDNFEVYMDKNVLKPLEMYRTYYDVSPRHLLRHRSNSYSIRNGEETVNGLDFDTGITTSNGGLNAPVGDLIRYMGFLTGDHEGYQIVKRTSLQEMWQSVVPVPSEDGLAQSMGLSFFILERGDLRVLGHTGTQMGFHSFFYMEPESGAAGVFVVNTYESADGPSPTRALSARFRDKLFDQLFPLFHQK